MIVEEDLAQGIIEHSSVDTFRSVVDTLFKLDQLLEQGIRFVLLF
jgi:hypothetical protein